MYCSHKTPRFYVLFFAEDVDMIQPPFSEREALSRHEQSRLRCNIVLKETEQERQQKKRERSTATTRLKRQTEVGGRRVSARLCGSVRITAYRAAKSAFEGSFLRLTAALAAHDWLPPPPPQHLILLPPRSPVTLGGVASSRQIRSAVSHVDPGDIVTFGGVAQCHRRLPDLSQRLPAI